MKFIILILISFLPLLVKAQQSDSQIAFNYYNNKEYVKAAEYFLQLYERTRSRSYLDYHIIALINGKQYEQAENTLKKYLKTDENNKEYLVNLGYVYEQQGKMSKSEDCFEKAIKRLIPQQTDIRNTANLFRNILAYDRATQTYLKGRELLKQPDAFMSELGDNYMMQRNYEEMLALFIRALELKPGDLSNIISKLNFARTYDVGKNVDALVKETLERILKQPGYNPVFDELAVWFSLQTGNYKEALSHAIQLNAKIANKVNLYIDIARDAASAKEYALAEEAYGKVLALGKENNNFYNVARKEILNSKYAGYSEHRTDIIQYKSLIGECENYIKETGYTPDNIDIINLSSDIYAYRLNLPDSANQILQKAEAIRQLNNITLSAVKSKRADLLAYMDNPWEATILYTQIEKANPNNDIGYEAKLKKAWLAYYNGDILWAKAQFDVLKGATSKLISNDALKMSHFINSNYDQDSDDESLVRLAQTEYLIYKKQYKEARPALDSLIQNSQPGIADYASLEKAQLLISEFKDEEAAEILKKLEDHSEQTYIRAEAIYELANLKARAADKTKALELYKILVSEYPGSVYSIEAGRLYRELEKNETSNQQIIP